MKTRLFLISTMVFALTSTVLAATDTNTTVTTSNTTVSNSGVSTDDLNVNTNNLPADTASESDNTETPLNAAEGKDIIVSPKGAVSNYTEVPCDKDYFISNSCNQCFDGGKKGVGEKIAGLNDSWTNPNSTEQIMYKSEQIAPEFINLGGANTNWLTNPQDPAAFWKQSDEIVWTDSATGSGESEFLLEGGKTVNLLEADLGASYALEKTDKVEGDALGLLKFTINYHDTDASAKESEKKIHTECVAYYASTPVAVTPTPVPVTPQEATKVKTGPENYVLIILALALSFGLIKYRKKA